MPRKDKTWLIRTLHDMAASLKRVDSSDLLARDAVVADYADKLIHDLANDYQDFLKYKLSPKAVKPAGRWRRWRRWSADSSDRAISDMWLESVVPLGEMVILDQEDVDRAIQEGTLVKELVTGERCYGMVRWLECPVE